MPAYDIGPRIGIDGEKEFKNSIKAIDSEIRALQNQLRTLSKEYDENDRSVEGVTKKQNALNQAIETSRKRIDLLTSQYEKQVQELKRLEDALEQARKENGEGSTEAQKAEAAYARQAKTVNDLGARLERAKGQLITFENQLQELGNTATRVGDQLQSAGDKIQGIGGKVSSLGNTLTAGVTAPILAIGTAAVTMGNDFEAQMDRVQAIAGATSTEMEALDAQALQLGADTSFSASEVAQGMENLASAGFTVDEIMAAMPGMLDLAASSGADLATSSEIAASAIRGFGLDASDASHVADVFAEAAARTNAQTEDMGEAMKYVAPVASSMSQSLEETAAAIGIMSDAGIKGSQAGTALRGALSRLAKPTKPMIETMEELGLSFYDASGNMLPLNQMVEQLQDRFQGLTQEQQNNALVTLFGQESLSGMLALIQRGPEELRDLTASFESADGAAAQMAETMLDNTSGSIEEMTGALETAGITIQRTLAPHIRDAAETVTDLVNEFSDLDEEQQKNIIGWAGIAAAAGPAVKILGTATTGLGKLAKGAGTVVSDLGKLVQSGGKATEGMSLFGKVLGTLGPKGLIIGGVVAGVAAIGTAIIKAREDVINAEIDEAFGDIKLSAEEVEDVAQRLTTTDWTVKLTAAIEAKEQVEEFQGQLEDSLEALNKLNWKVDVGLELTEEEKSAYLANVESFAQSASEYISSQGYSISLALKATFGEGDVYGASLDTFAQDYLAQAQGELDSLGEQLAEMVNEAFENNTFAEDRVDIQKIIDQMNGIVQQIQEAETRAKLSNIQVEYETSGLGIDKESFDKLNQQISENTQELIDSAEENRVTALTSVELQYQEMIDSGVDKAFADKVREDARKRIEAETSQNVGESINVGFNFAFDTITENFETEVTQAETTAKQVSQRYAGIFTQAIQDGNVELQNSMNTLFQTDFPELTGAAKQAVQDMLESLQPQKEELEAIRDSCLAAGEEVPQSVTEGLSNIALWEAMTGNTDAMYAMLAQTMVDNPAQLEALAEAQRSGQQIPEALAEYIMLYSGLVWDASTGMWTELNTNNAESAAEAADYLNQYGAEMGESLAQSIADQYGLVYENGKWMVSQAAQGVRDQTPEFVGESETMATDAIVAANAITSAAVLGAPAIATPDMVTPVANARSSAQQYLWNNPITVAVNAVASGVSAVVAAARGYETGGIVDTPQLATVAENGAEAIIPLEHHRSRALDLWYQAGQELNAFAADSARAVGAARREQIIQHSTDNRRQYTIEEGAITIHTQATDGKQLYKELVREMQKDVKRKEAAYGRF